MDEQNVDHKDLHRSAAIKAAIVAFVNSSEDRVKQAGIAKGIASKMEELGYTKDQLTAFLSRLAKNSLIAVEREGRSVWYSRYVKNKPNGVPIRTDTTAIKQADPVKTVAPALPPPDIKVDIIKATGKVRLTLNGFSIEIGTI